jgi:NADH-quinone oxidoreductase subunit L
MAYIWLIPLLPGIGAAINGLVGIRAFSKKTAGVLACTMMTASLVLALVAFWQLLGLPADARHHDVVVAQWIPQIPLMLSNGTVGGFQVPWGFRLDPLSGMMILIVTGIGTLIHVYSTAYIQDEPRGGVARFFCYLNLFCFFMLMLVLGNNFLVMFVGWEGVGLCSYLLIGYWYEKKSASDAGKKAFITNRIGDWGFILGIFLVYMTFGTLNFREVQNAAATMPVEAQFGVLSTICLLLFVGATGKSAQIPLYVWLPDAMEGPTPVSALIHAATMVTAGVYMLGRNAVLFSHAPIVLSIVAVVGVLTAFFAASIGLVQYDIKRVLAYSTVSQLGYMFTAMGVGAFSAGAFHLMTHAFFKALLFLGSGSVIHAMGGEQDMRRMGGLKKYMPVTFATMMVATLAIAGIPPFAGFFSKDEILAQAFQHNKVVWVIGVAAAMMTAFYMWRLMAMTFWGAYRGPAWDSHGHGPVESAPAHAADTSLAAAHGAAHPADLSAHGHGREEDHEVTHGPAHPEDAAAGGHAATGSGHGGHGAWHGPHESPTPMTFPLMALAVGAVVAGFFGVPHALWGTNAIEHFLDPSFTAERVAGEVPNAAASIDAAGLTAGAAGETGEGAQGVEEMSTGVEWGLMLFSVGIAVAGILLAQRFYVTSPETSERMKEQWAGPHRVLTNKYYVDELYGATVIKGTFASGRGLWGFDRTVVDGAVNGTGWLTLASSWLSSLTDRSVVDGLVNLVGRVCEEGSFWFRRVQSGLVQNYALLMLVGVFAFVSVYLFMFMR